MTREFAKTRWQQARISPYWKGRLVEFFCLGVPAYRLRFQLPLDPKSVQRWYRILSETIWEKACMEIHALDGTIELDEALFGGRSHGKRGWGAVSNKHMVFGIYQRDGKVITFPVPSRGSKDLAPLILKHTKAGSLFYTDDWHAYTFLPVRGDHVVIQKQKGRAKGRNHINGIEGFWSYAKHCLYHYRGVPKTHFHLCLKEVEWRFNPRNQNLVTLLRTYLRMPVPSPSGA